MFSFVEMVVERLKIIYLIIDKQLRNQTCVAIEFIGGRDIEIMAV